MTEDDMKKRAAGIIGDTVGPGHKVLDIGRLHALIVQAMRGRAGPRICEGGE